MTAVFDDGDVIRARYAVGADGIRSTVREHAGIGFQGDVYDESFTLADVRLAGDAPVDEVILFWAKAGLTVVAPLPGGIHRIVAPVSDAPEEPTAAFVQQLLDERGLGAGRMIVTDVVWGSRFRIHHRVADTYRAGRLLLAGDAAHVHSPAGGQGMNLGIQDAVALADALVAVLAGAPDSGARRLQRGAATHRPWRREDDRSTDPVGHPAAGRASDPQHRYRAGRTDTCGSPRFGPAAQRAGLPLSVAHRDGCGTTTPLRRRRPPRGTTPSRSAMTVDGWPTPAPAWW